MTRFTFRRSPGRMVVRFAFSLRKRMGRFYDIRTDEMVDGQYLSGRVIEFSWVCGKRPALSCTPWSAPR